MKLKIQLFIEALCEIITISVCMEKFSALKAPDTIDYYTTI